MDDDIKYPNYPCDFDAPIKRLDKYRNLKINYLIKKGINEIIFDIKLKKVNYSLERSYSFDKGLVKINYLNNVFQVFVTYCSYTYECPFKMKINYNVVEQSHLFNKIKEQIEEEYNFKLEERKHNEINSNLMKATIILVMLIVLFVIRAWIS